jgi:hypothetical protein
LQENNNKNRLEDMRFYLHNLMKSAPENAEFIQHLFHTYKELWGNGLVEENYYERKRNYTK